MSPLVHRCTRYLLLAVIAAAPSLVSAQGVGAWAIHDTLRPQPPIVDPGTAAVGALAQRPPSDAVILFDGADLSEWRSGSGGPAGWRVQDGHVQVVGGSGEIVSARAFGDVQLHIEWATPSPARGSGQARGNSGVFLMGRYEVQVLDSYQNRTYPDGQAAAIYGQYPPLVNASRPPGEWQTYDIVFRRPRFDANGALVSPARMTVFHNGVLVQDDVELTGPSGHQSRPPYERHADRLPIRLQDHGDPVRFRYIWVRELPER